MNLKNRHRLRYTTETVQAQKRQLRVCGQVGDRVSDCFRNEHLTAVCGAGHSRSDVNGESDVVVILYQHLASVNPHSNPNRRSARPRVRSDGPLRPDRRRHGITRIIEHRKDGVALGADLDAAVITNRLA
jgi:hypothetical protein